MFKNLWWALEFSENVTSKPQRLTALNMELVLWRRPDGKAVVMSDLCVHRGGALSDGWVAGDCIVCPYHGWQFNEDGSCAKIPANQPGRVIPPKSRVDSYPTVERYGWVWAFMGDLPEDERPPFPELPFAEDPGFRRITGEFKWNAHYDRVLENSMDIAHAPFVHAGSFGNPDKPEVEEFKVQYYSDWAAGAEVTLEPPTPKGLWGKFMSRRERKGIRTATAFYFPNITKLEVDLPIGKMVLLNAIVPVDDHTTITKWTQYRNFFTGSWADRDARKRTDKIFLEDVKIVEEQRPELLPFDLADEMHVKSDAIQIAYRRMRNECIKRGWLIDSHRVRSGYTGREATVIPSPARREIAELRNAWVRKEVPVVSLMEDPLYQSVGELPADLVRKDPSDSGE